MPISEQIPQEKKPILEAALAHPDQETSKSILSKATERGWYTADVPQQEASVVQKAAGFGMGAAEAYNPLSVPRSIETIGRALLHPTLTGEYKEDAFGNKTIPVENTQDTMAKAESNSVLPDLSVKGLISKIPGTEKFIQGIPQSYETAGGLAALAAGGVEGVRGLLKGSPIKQALKAESGVIKNTKYLLNEPEGPIMDAILQRPEQVAELYKQQKFGVDDLAGVVSSALDKKQAQLGTNVGAFRDAAKADTKPSIATAPILQGLSKVEADSKLANGTSVISPKDQGKIDELKSFLSDKKISPRDALAITDWIDNNTNYNAVSTGNISQSVANAIGTFRGKIKGLVRGASKDMEAWAKADDQYSNFVEEAKGLQDKFSGDQRISAVQNLLNPSKEPIKERLANALNIGSEAGPSKAQPADDFFAQLADRRAAQGMKALDVSKVDPIRDQTNRVFQKWMKIGESVGTAVGAGIGAKLKGTTGAFVGAPVGGFAGHMIAQPFARYMASPERILEKAIKAKDLSKQAKDLATDLSFLQKTFGTEGANMLVNTIKGSVPAVNELANYLGENK